MMKDAIERRKKGCKRVMPTACLACGLAVLCWEGAAFVGTPAAAMTKRVGGGRENGGARASRPCYGAGLDQHQHAGKRASSVLGSSPAVASSAGEATKVLTPPEEEGGGAAAGLQRRNPFSPRVLGSFEKLLTKTLDARDNTLATPHVFTAILGGEASPSREALKAGVMVVLARHPMLRAAITGTADPGEVVAMTIRKNEDDADPLVFRESPLSLEELADRVIAYGPEDAASTHTEGGSGRAGVVSDEAFDLAWQTLMQHQLDHASLDIPTGPNWRMDVLRGASGTKTALIFTMNHAIDDQKSGNIFLHDLLTAVAAAEEKEKKKEEEEEEESFPLPPSMESAIVKGNTFSLNTLMYMGMQALNGAKGPQLLPDSLPSVLSPARRGSFGLDQRSTICSYRSLPRDRVTAALTACRARGLTLTAALAAAVLMSTSDAIHAGGSEEKGEAKKKGWEEDEVELMDTFKFLLSLDMRPYADDQSDKDWTRGTVACAGGAMDIFASVKTNSGTALRKEAAEGGEGGRGEASEAFWELARKCKQDNLDFVKRSMPREAVAVFHWGMRKMEMRDICELEARNPLSLGRAFTCGVSNAGRYGQEPLYGKQGRGRLSLEGIYYATAHTAWGTTYQVSCVTVGEELCLTFQFPSPIVSSEAAEAFADSVLACLEAGCSSAAGV